MVERERLEHPSAPFLSLCPRLCAGDGELGDHAAHHVRHALWLADETEHRIRCPPSARHVVQQRPDAPIRPSRLPNDGRSAPLAASIEPRDQQGVLVLPKDWALSTLHS